jgi:hypothetical protein
MWKTYDFLKYHVIDPYAYSVKHANPIEDIPSP